jgi:hypothetical protein
LFVMRLSAALGRPLTESSSVKTHPSKQSAGRS